MSLTGLLAKLIPEDEYFLDYMTITVDRVITGVDIDDDMNRDLVVRDMAQEAIHMAEANFKEMNMPFFPPENCRLPFIKNEDHMAIIRDRLAHEEARKLAAEQARHRRDLLKNGKKLTGGKEREKRAAEKAT
ncbi:eukaryotic rRNA processing protein, partial [Kipferlia bialata]|eukprot:g9441.t1